MEQLTALAYLHSAGFTHKDLKKLFSEHQDYARVYADFLGNDAVPTPWMTPERRAKIITKFHAQKVNHLETIIEEKQIHIVTINDTSYPERLRAIRQSPYLLYVRGVLHDDASKMIGIVGSRASTTYGKKSLEHIIPELVSAGCGIVSGGAQGIDSLAHEITLKHSGYTISVFGCGVDIAYPPQNTPLFQSILDHDGALISIFPIGTKPEPFYFPIRNEIVAALSDGILIPEAATKSGTLITAGLALEHGRDVFAIPGDIFRATSNGTNALISHGEAKGVQFARDILEEYFPSSTGSTMSLFATKTWNSEDEKQVYTAICDGYTTPDAIGENTDLTIDTIIMTLSLLEIGGHIGLSAGGRYEVL